MKVDTHVHSYLSFDSTALYSSIARNAQKNGVDIVCITDHLDYDLRLSREIGCKCTPYELNLDRVDKKFASFTKHYQGKTRFLKGVEIGYSPEVTEDYARAIDAHDFDVVLNSVHTINGYDPYYGGYFAKEPKKAAKDFLDKILASVYAPISYDIITHIAYVFRYSAENEISKDYFTNPQIYMDILKAVVEKDKCLELNTSTKGKMDTCPPPAIFRLFKELGGKKVTIGSDAHFPKLIGNNFDYAKQVLIDAGFGETTYYEKRKEHTCPLY